MSVAGSRDAVGAPQARRRQRLASVTRPRATPCHPVPPRAAPRHRVSPRAAPRHPVPPLAPAPYSPRVREIAKNQNVSGRSIGSGNL